MTLLLRLALIWLSLFAVFGPISVSRGEDTGRRAAVGKAPSLDIYSVMGPEGPSTWQTLVDEAVEYDFVLLGETHDNPTHHLVQAEIVRELVFAGRRPAIVWEMVPRGKQTMFDAFADSGETYTSKLGDLLSWSTSGWPAWSLYEPIAEEAISAGLPMVAADLDPHVYRTIATEGPKSLPPRLRDRLGLSAPLPENLEAALRDLLQESHCSSLPDQAVDAMISVQRARDGALADAMMGTTADGAVLIAGRGHVRTDWAAPRVLRARVPEARILSVGLIGADPGSTGRFDVKYEEWMTMYDFVVVTSSVTGVVDPCNVR
ncbi:MAG: ChaN family lipoprotein [Pseudomonadota bacterium]